MKQQLRPETIGINTVWWNGTRYCTASDIDGGVDANSWWRGTLQRRYHSVMAEFMGVTKFMTAVVDDYGTLVEVPYEVAA